MLDLSLFNPTAKRIGFDIYKFYRTKDWTSNGFWCLKSIYEPKWMSVLKNDKTHLNNKAVQRVVKDAQFGVDYTKDEVHPTNRLVTAANVISVRMRKETDRTFQSWLNIYYFSFFKKIFAKKFINVKYYQADELKPVIVKSGEDIVGLIMPMRYDPMNDE